MIVITGASGLLGSNLLRELSGHGLKVTGIFQRHSFAYPGVQFIQADLTHTQELHRIITDLRPEWILHCAALTDVDYCEEHPDQAHRVNTLASRELALAAKNVSARFLYVSTDSVFDGRRGSYAEEDVPAPLNTYARTKWNGEQEIREVIPEAIILRTNMYGWNIQQKHSLAEWIVVSLEEHTPIVGFTDVVFNPLLVNDLSEIIFALIRRNASGLYHAGSSDSCSKYDFAIRLARLFGLDPLITEGSLSHSTLKTQRPFNTSLHTAKLSQFLNQEFPDIQAGLMRFKKLRETRPLLRLRTLNGME